MGRATRRRWWWKLLLGVVLSPVLILGLALVALRVESVRTYVALQLIKLANDSMDEKLTLEGIERLNPWGVRVRHVLLKDQDGNVWVDANDVDASIDLWGLLNQHVDIGHAHVASARIALFLDDDKKPEKDEDDEGDDEPSGWRVTIPEARVAVATLSLPSSVGVLDARVSEVEGAFYWQDAFLIGVRSAKLHAALGKKRVLDALLRGSDWSSQKGGKIDIDGKLVNARLHATTQLSGLDVDTAWPQGKATLSLHGVDGRTLVPLGVDPTWLEQRVDLTLHVQAGKQAVDYQASIGVEKTTSPTPLSLRGKIDRKHVQADLHVPELSAQKLSEYLPSGTVGGRVTAAYTFAGAGGVHASWKDVIVADVRVPAGKLSGRTTRHALSIDALQLSGYEEDLSARAHFNLDSGVGDAKLSIKRFDLGRLEVLRREPLHGVVTGELDLHVAVNERLSAKARLRAEHLGLRSMRARHAEVNATARGSLSAPEVQADLKVEGLEIEHVPVQTLHAALDMHGKAGTASVEARGKDLVANLKLTGTEQGEGYLLRGGGNLKHDGDKLTLQVEGQSSQAGLTFGLGLGGNGGSLDARIEERGRKLLANMEAKKMDIAPLLRLIGIEKQTAQLDGKLQAEIPRQGESLALSEGRYQAELRVELPATPVLALIAPSLSSLTGSLEASLRASGTLADLRANISARAELRLPEHDTRPEVIELTASIAKDSATAKLVAEDLEGALLNVNAEIGAPMAEAVARLREKKILPFALDVKMTPRRLDLMQGVLAYLAGTYALDFPALVGGTINLSGKDEQVEGRAALRVTLFGDAVDETCVAGAHTDITMDANLEGGELTVKAAGHGDKGGKLTLELKSRVREDGLGLMPADLQLHGRDVLINTLPSMCSLQGGKAALAMVAHGLGGEEPDAELSVYVDGLRGGDTQALNVAVKAQLQPKQLSAQATVRAAHGDAAQLRASVPLRMEGVVPTLDMDAPVDGRVVLRDMPVASFLSVGEGLGSPEGQIRGDLSVRGAISDPHLAGFVAFEHVSMSIASIAQPLREVSGRVDVKDRTLRVSSLSARDGKGKVEVDAQATMAKDWSGQFSANVSADKFPIRRQGETVGALTTKMAFEGKLNSALDLTGTVSIKEGRFEITGNTGSAVQELDKHVEIRFVDARGQADALKASKEAKEDAKDRSLALTSLSVKSERDVLFVHPSFNVKLGVALELLTEDGDEKLVGEVQIRGGELELIGKNFQIERGAVKLTGDYPPDPELELRASFEPPAGETLFVEVHGNASSPIVTFSGAADTAEEAIAIVSGVGVGAAQNGAEQRARSDARAFATNITAGLLSATARRRLGKWVPLISVESNALGNPDRARAGFDASKLIPEFLRPLARGAYVEGIVGNTRQTRGGSVGLGVRLEIAMPRDFVTSLGYGPGPTWGTDLTWVP